MELVILNETVTYGNSIAELNRMIAEIEARLEKAGLRVQSMIVDGHEIYDEYFEWLESRIGDLGRVEVVAKTSEQIRDDIMISVEEFLTRAVVEIKGVAAQFHQGASAETWDAFVSFLDSVQWIDSYFQSVLQNGLAYAGWDGYKEQMEELNQGLVQLEEPMEAQDTTLIGDILLYEVLPAVERLLQQVTLTLNSEVQRHDLN